MRTPLAYPVIFSAAEAHLTNTVRAGVEIQGSVFHPEVTQFAGLVTRVRDDGAADLIIFPPGRDPRAVEGVEEGDGPGRFQMLGDPREERADPKD